MIIDVIKAMKRMQYIAQIDVLQFVWLNYFSQSIERHGKGKVVPYKHAILDLDKTAKIIVGEKHIEVGTNRLKKSKAETRIRLRAGAIWNATGGCEIAYGATLELLKNARLSSGYFTMNSDSVVVAAKNIIIGEDVMIARNAMIYDSDFHPINNDTVQTKPVIIQDHVWIGVNSIVLKGCTIGQGSMIAANTLITKNVGAKEMVGQESNIRVFQREIFWKR